jgi:hypothetical protein
MEFRNPNKKLITKYEKITEKYMSGQSIPEACAELGMTANNYYKICKKLGRRSIASIKKTNKNNLQLGGNFNNKIKSDIINNEEHDNNPKEQFYANARKQLAAITDIYKTVTTK